VQLRHHPSTGAHHDATNIVIVRGLVGDEDAVVVESAVGHGGRDRDSTASE
jgi:hypothetical protein